ncbi:MAG: hypothetical protein WBA92_09620 [Pseudorhodobacter sp.]
MQDIIEPIIHKAAVIDLKIALKNTGLSIGDTAELHLTDEGKIAVYAHIRKRSFLFHRRKLALIGHLGAKATPLLTPALRRGDYLRVRVVGLTPEHLASDGKAEMHVSVWGTARHFFTPPPNSSLEPTPSR